MNQCKSKFKSFLRNSIHTFRLQNHYSQERMAELLNISPRSYIDQEHGKYSFSALTMLYYFLQLSNDEVLCFLSDFKALLEQETIKDNTVVEVNEAQSYRNPVSVTHILHLKNGGNFPICPRCNITLEREYQAYCDRCGQCLDWRYFNKATIITKN